MQQNNTLSKDSADKNPFGQFSQWYKTASDAGFIHHDAMMLATADKNGKPAARIVLLKSFDEKGFVFFTNYGSRKGNELAANPYAALLFYWDKIDKQVRIEGSVEKISKEESEVYFHSRPRGSQVGALVSPQSKVIKDRDYLENLFSELSAKYEGKEIPLPENWGGYLLKPYYFEFWQSRDNRLHDRIRYVREDGGWKTERLAP